MSMTKRILIIAAVIILCAGIGFGADCLLYGQSEHTEEQYAGRVIYSSPEDVESTNEASFEGSRYVPGGMDPWFTVYIEDPSLFDLVRITLNSPVEADTAMQLFYMNETGFITEEASRVVTFPAGSTEETFQIPEDQHILLRFDIEDSIDLKQIEAGRMVTVTLPYRISWGRVLTITGILLAVCLLGWILIRNKLLIRFLIIAVISLCLAAAFDIASWYVSPEDVTYRQEGNVQELNYGYASLFGCTINSDGEYHPLNNDPQMHFGLYSDTIESMVIYLKEPLKAGTGCQVFYVNDSHGLSEDNSVLHSVRKGTKQIAFTLPRDAYTFLRIDLDGDMVIDHFAISDGPAIRDYTPPIRWTRIGIIALILTCLIFCYTSVPVVKETIAYLKKKIIDYNTRLKTIDILYAVFAGAMVLHHIYVTLNYAAVPYGAHVFRVWFIVFAVVSVLLGQMWRDKGFWFLGILLLFQYLRLNVPNPTLADTTEHILIHGIYAFFGCYSVGKALSPRMRKPFLNVFCAIWTVAALIWCCAGIIAAWTGNPVANPVGGLALVRGGRLWNNYYCVVTGVVSSASFAVALLGFSLTKRKWIRALYLLAGIVMVISGDLSGTRTGYMLAAAAAAIMICIPFYNKLNPAKNPMGRYRMNPGQWIALGLVFAVLFAGFTFSQTYVTDAFNRVRATRGELLIHSAMAESAAPAAQAVPQVYHRGFDGTGLDSISSGRLTIWKNALQIITRSPENLFLGQSIDNPMKYVNGDLKSSVGYGAFQHCHNIWIQNLLESGIPGLLLLVSLHILFIINAFSLLMNRDLPLWQRAVPVPAFAILISEVVEATTHPAFGYPPMTLFYLFAGLTVALSAASRSRKSLEETTQP